MGVGNLELTIKNASENGDPLEHKPKSLKTPTDTTESNAYVKEETEIKCVLN